MHFFSHAKKLKNDLLEIEVYEKQQLADFIKVFIKDVAEKNVLMGDKTDVLKQSLDAKKTLLKEKIANIVTEMRNQLEAYNELMQEKEAEAEKEKEEEVDEEEKKKKIS